MVINLALLGCGTVGLKFLELIQEKKSDLKNRYNIELSIVGVADSTGVAIDETGLDIDQIIEVKEKQRKIGLYPEKGELGVLGSGILDRVKVDVVIEAGVSDVETGGLSLEYAKKALGQGVHVVFVSKGALVHSYDELAQIAAKHNAELKVSGATAAALPTVDVALQSLAGTEIELIQGIFNGTTNYILTQMTQHEVSYQDALKKAQEKGIAEPDPTNDVEGYDTASKVLILANAVMNANLTFKDVEITGITEVTKKQIESARKNGQVIKLMGIVRKENGQIKAVVKPEKLIADHPMANVHNSEKGIHFVTDTMGDLTVIGGRSDPKAAAAAALKDTIMLTQNRVAFENIG
ncbi:homoserine dehydrogenase [Pseudogracilibacillus sp. SE30717A]|uniref:homoserine dehydrogenase n=1 Tax=Pseudogracilibacillus sp. SE30717A TaxID=3098293 RepID=UPI00300DD805